MISPRVKHVQLAGKFPTVLVLMGETHEDN